MNAKDFTEPLTENFNQIIGHEEVKLALLLGIISREHIYIEGPPGTAKTMLSEIVADSLGGIEGLKIFKYQMHKDLRLSELTQGDRVIETKENENEKIIQYEPFFSGILTADISLLDEIGHTPGESLNVLMSILNERQFRGKTLNLITAIATSNYTILSNPDSPITGSFYNEPLSPPMIDRFLIQVIGHPLMGKDWVKAKRLMMEAAEKYNDSYKIKPCLTRGELERCQERIHFITVPEHVIDAVLNVYKILINEYHVDIQPGSIMSDRTFLKKIIKLLRAHAFLYNRGECSDKDLAVLPFITPFRIPHDIHEKMPEIIKHVIAQKNSARHEKKQEEKGKDLINPFEAPHPQEIIQSKKESHQEQLQSDNSGSPEDIEMKTGNPDDPILFKPDTEENDTEMEFNPDANEAGPEEKEYILKGKVVQERVKDIMILFQELDPGIKRGLGKEEAVRSGGNPRSWRPMKDFSEYADVPHFEKEYVGNYHVPDQKEKKKKGILVLRDISSSMHEEQAEIASRVIHGVIDFAAHQQIWVALLRFHKSVAYTNGYIFTKDYRFIRRFVENTDVMSATNYELAFKETLRIVRAAKGISVSDIIVVGDGRPTIGDFFVAHERKELKNNGIRVHTIFTHNQEDCEYPMIFKNLVRETKGSAYDIFKDYNWKLRKINLAH